MYNDLFSIGPLTIHGYGLMIAIGILAVYLVGEYRAQKQGLDKDMIFSLVLWCVIGGFSGSKILYIITVLPSLFDGSASLVSISSGWVVYGGIIGGIFAGWLCCHVKKKPFLKYFDLVMPLVAMAQGFGRIGCLLAGCCYGKETDSAFHITFTHSDFAPNNVNLIPTQIISSVLDFVLFAVLSVYATHTKKDGRVAALYLILYSIGRYIVEMFRGDIARGNVGVFSTSQFISLFLLAAGVVLFVTRRKEKRTLEEEE